MEIGRLPISASQRGKLLSAGYTTLSSLSSISPSQLAQDIKISEAEAAEILKLVSPSIRLEKSDKSPAVINGALSAWDMLHEEDMFNRITTSCADLDEILGGGISCKEVTEIGGVPGIGKTQLGIQLAVNVQIPIEYGGLGGKAIYIDTEGSFMVERALQVSEGCVDDMLNNNSYRQTYFQASEPKLQPKHFLQNIYYFRVCSYTEQIALTNYLEKFISEHKDVKIVIIDSITFHFRQDFENLALRTRVLGEMALKLLKLAKNFNLAFLSASNISRTKVATEQHWFWGRLVFVKPKIVLLNQVTTKYTDGSFQLTLALGDSWSHSSTNRIILYWNGNDRCAYIDKSPSLRSASASYSVTQKGIRACSSIYKRVKMM